MMFVHHTDQIHCDVRCYGDALLCCWFHCSDLPTSEPVQVKCTVMVSNQMKYASGLRISLFCLCHHEDNFCFFI